MNAASTIRVGHWSAVFVALVAALHANDRSDVCLLERDICTSQLSSTQVTAPGIGPSPTPPVRIRRLRRRDIPIQTR